MENKKRFGLVLPKKAESVRLKGSVLFDNDSDEDSCINKTCTKIPQAKPKKSIKVEQLDDLSIYEYDSIYDDMKAKEVSDAIPTEKKSSRYIDSLLKAAEKRKKEYERRVEKKIQVEREKEGDKFKDKEEFVSSTYKKKLLEREEEEERERRENMLNDMMDVTKQKDLSGFYRHFLKQTVGEEKIPEFGERFSIKKEVMDESESVSIQKCPETTSSLVKDTKDLHANQFDDDDSASSSSDDEEHITRKSSVANSDENPGNADLQGKDNNASPRNICDSEEKHENSKLHEKLRKRKVEHCKEICDLSDDEIESNPEPPVKKIDYTSVIKTSDESEGNKHEESKALKLRRNIFAKRTVGSIFDEAQARYFQRMATRNA